MTRDETLNELESLCRQSEDAARACDAEAAAFRSEYETLIDLPHNDASVRRILELYAYAVDRPRDATRLRKEVATFRSAISLICGGGE